MHVCCFQLPSVINGKMRGNQIYNVPNITFMATSVNCPVLEGGGNKYLRALLRLSHVTGVLSVHMND